MTFQIADSILEKAGLSEKDVLLQLAIALFREDQVTLTQGAKIAKLHQSQFQKELASRKIPVHYDLEEFDADLKMIKKIRE